MNQINRDEGWWGFLSFHSGDPFVIVSRSDHLLVKDQGDGFCSWYIYVRERRVAFVLKINNKK